MSSKKDKSKLFTNEVEVIDDKKIKKNKEEDERRKRLMFKSSRSSSSKNLTSKKIDSGDKFLSKDDLKLPIESIKPRKSDKKKLKKATSSSNLKSKMIKPDSKTKLSKTVKEKDSTEEDIKVKHQKYSSSESTDDNTVQTSSEDTVRSDTESIKETLLKKLPMFSKSFNSLPSNFSPDVINETKEADDEQDNVKDIPEELILKDIPLSPHGRGIDPNKSSPRASYVIASPRDDKSVYSKELNEQPLSPTYKMGRVRSFTDVMDQNKIADKAREKEKEPILKPSTPPPPQPLTPPPPPPLPGQTVIVNAKYIEDNYAEESVKVTERKRYEAVEEEYKHWDFKSSDFEKRLFELKLDRSNIQSMFNFPENDIIIELVESELNHYPSLDDSAPLTVKDCYNYFTSKKIKIRMQSEWYGGITSHKDRVKDFELRKNTNNANSESGKPKSAKLDIKKTPTRQVQKRKNRIMSSSERLEKISELDFSDKTDESEEVSDAQSETESSDQTETKIKISKSNSFNKRNRSPLIKREKSDDRRIPIIVSKSDRPRSLSISISDTPAFHLNPDFLNFDDKTRKKEAEKRDRIRKDLFECFTPSTITSEPSDEVQDLKSNVNDIGTRILFNFKNVKVNAGSEEPFWFSATFYDISKQCRLTETFYFDFNSENELIKTFVIKHYGDSNAETQAKRFIPNFPYCNENIYLVVRVSTVIRGDIETIAEPHSQGNSMSTKEKQKWIDSSRQATQLLGMYQQSFGWGFVQVFDEKGKLKLANENIISIYKMKQSLTDSLLYDQLAKSDEVKKHKPLNFTINISANLYSEDKYVLNERVDSMLVHYPKPIEKHNDNDKASMILKNLVKPPQEINEVVKELDNFYIHSTKNHPHDHFINNLYIYPLSANFQTSKIHKAKRIACKVFVIELTDKEEDAVPIQNVAMDAIYGRSCGPNFKKYSSTTVWIDTNSPNMWDEIKVKLPLNLTERHHLLFSFYNVNIKILTAKPGKQSVDDPLDNLIGYCFVPLTSNNQIIKDNEHIYPIKAAPFGDGDIKNYDNKNTSDDEYIDREKVVFTFKSRLISTILTQDENMNSYFVHCNSGNKGKKELKKALDRLMSSAPEEVLRFFPVLLNQLFVFLCDTTNESLQQHIFKTIVWIASKVFDKTLTSGKVSVSHDLLVYAKNDFRNPVKCKLYPSTVILQHWVNLLEEGDSLQDSQVSDLAAFSVKEISWFLFELIFKSLVLKLTSNNESRKEATKPIKKQLKKIVQKIDNYRRKTASGFEFINRVFAKMITRMFHVIDRGFVFDLIHEYLKNLKGERSTVGYRFIFLQIVSDFEHYIQLNLPQLTPIDSCEVLPLKLWKNHYLAGLYINELIESLLSQEDTKISRVKAITRFRDLLWKHHIDDRYDNDDKRMRIASIYFPLFLRIVENFQVFQTKTKDDNTERIEWCICNLWILKHCSRDVHLRQWWKNESDVNVANFFSLLKLCYETFSNDEGLKSEIIYLMIEIYDLIMDDLYSEMNSPGSKMFESLSTSILYLLRLPKTEHATLSLLKVIRTFTTKFKKPLFRYLNNYMFCGDLTYEVFNLCQGKSKKIMTAATSILYLLLRSNNEEMKHFARMKLLSTSAISKLVKRSDCNVDDIKNCLEAMAHYQDECSTLLSWENQIREFINRNSRIIKYNLEIQSIPNEFNDLKAENMNQISLEYIYSPDLRITWLENLTSHYVSYELYEEAALCKILIASLISEYLVHISNNKNNVKGVPDDYQAYTKIFPSIKEEKSFSTIWLEGNTILSPDFSEDGFLKNMNSAIEYFLKSENLESCVEVYSLLIHYYKENKKYEMLSQCSQQLSKVSQTLFESSQSQNRIPPNFYRVGFYGAGFEEDNGKEYIYREPPSVRLPDFTQMMCNRYITKFGKDNFELLKNKPLEELDIDPKKNYIQIVACEISFSFEELISKDRLTYADRSFDIKKFYFETPYIKEGTKPTEDVGQIWKRKIILYPAKAPPYHLQRIQVIKKETQILTPIQSAIDVVTGFVTNIKQQLNCVPPNIKNVQIILQGSILTQVNAGPLAIIREFLGNASKYPNEEVKKLRTILNTFLRFSQFGMRLTAQLILTEKSLEPLHKEISKSLDALQSEASKYMEL